MPALIELAAKEGELVPSEPVSKALGNLPLKFFQVRVRELDRLAGRLVDQMVVMVRRRLEVPCARAKGLALDDTRRLELP